MDNMQFYTLSVIFQSYQDDEFVIMKAVCNETPCTIEKIPASSRSLSQNC